MQPPSSRAPGCALVAVLALVGGIVGLVVGYSHRLPGQPTHGPVSEYPLPHHIPKYPGGISLRKGIGQAGELNGYRALVAIGALLLVLRIVGLVPGLSIPIAPFTYVETSLWGGLPVTDVYPQRLPDLFLRNAHLKTFRLVWSLGGSSTEACQ